MSFSVVRFESAYGFFWLLQASFRKLHILTRTFYYKHIIIFEIETVSQAIYMRNDDNDYDEMWYMQICHVVHLKSQHKSFSFQPMPKMNIYVHVVWENECVYVCVCRECLCVYCIMWLMSIHLVKCSLQKLKKNNNIFYWWCSQTLCVRL